VGKRKGGIKACPGRRNHASRSGVFGLKKSRNRGTIHHRSEDLAVGKEPKIQRKRKKKDEVGWGGGGKRTEKDD